MSVETPLSAPEDALLSAHPVILSSTGARLGVPVEPRLLTVTAPDDTCRVISALSRPAVRPARGLRNETSLAGPVGGLDFEMPPRARVEVSIDTSPSLSALRALLLFAIAPPREVRELGFPRATMATAVTLERAVVLKGEGL